MSLSREQVRHVAQLARLSLTEEEEVLYQGQLSAILEAVEQLEGVDTSSVEPIAHAIEERCPPRDDVVHESLSPERALANAPAKVGTSFAVPRIIE